MSFENARHEIAPQQVKHGSIQVLQGPGAMEVSDTSHPNKVSEKPLILL